VSFGSKIKTLRMKKGVSLQVMADALKISKAHLWDLESGRSSNPSVDLLKGISSYLNVSVSSLVGEEPTSDSTAEAKAMFRQLSELRPEDRQLLDGLLKQLHQRKTDGNKD